MKNISYVIFRSNVIYFAQKGPIKVQIIETFECLDINSPNSYHFGNNKSISLQISKFSAKKYRSVASHDTEE